MTRYKVDGMTCGGCATSVTKALQAAAPNVEVEVDLDSGTVSVTGLEESAAQQAIEDAGFDFAGLA